MLGIVTTLSSIEIQPVYSKVELSASTEYLINTDNIVKMQVYGTTDSLVRYTFNKSDDQRFSEEFIFDETNAAIQTLSDATADSNMILLPVYEDCLNFADAASLTAVDKYFNIADIVWGTDNSDGTLSKLIIVEGGFKEKQYIVNYNINQIVDVADTGTTTTTTTTTT